MGVKLLSTLLAVIIFGTVDCRDIELELEEMEGVGRTTDLWEPRRRNLDIFKTSQGKKCKQCLEDQNYFCLNAVGSSGVCCDNYDDCDEVDVCSYYAPQSSIGLKFWSCPNDLAVCGVENLFVPNENGQSNTIRPRGNYQDSFNDNAMCRYRIIFPPSAREFDQINFILQKNENVSVYLTETITYKSLEYLENYMRINKVYTVTWPNEAFILVMADTDSELSDYSISYQYNDRDPQEVIDAMTPEERAKYYQTTAIYETETVKDTKTFWLFIVGGICGLALIIVLIIFLIRLKKKNDLIVAKVEKLSLDKLTKSEMTKEEKNDDFYTSQREALQKQQELDAMPNASPFTPDIVSSTQKSPQVGVEMVQSEQPILHMRTADVGKIAKDLQRINTVTTYAKGQAGSPHIEQESDVKRTYSHMVPAANTNRGGPAEIALDKPNDSNNGLSKVEQDKIQKMKDLLKKGTVEMPKRTNSIAMPPSAVKLQSAGYVDYDSKPSQPLQLSP